MLPTEIEIVTTETGPLDFEAKWRGRRIGYVYCAWTGLRLKILDLHVEAQHPVPWCCFHRFLLRLGFSPRKVSFRGKGIGGHLLKCVLAQAAAQRAEEVWGEVVQKDIDHTPFLLKWYEHQGFTVSAPDGECIATAVKKVSKKLRPG